MKKNGLFKIISIIALVLLVLTWIIPSSGYNGEIVNVGLMRVGIFDLLGYSTLAVTTYFFQLFLLIVIIGGFYGVLSNTPKYRSMLEKIAKSLKGKELIFLSITSFVFAALSSVFGLGVILFVFIPPIIGIIMLMGYDKLTAMLTTFASIMVGVIGSTYSPYVTGYINEYAGTNYETLMFVKVALFVLTVGAFIAFTIMYAKKHKSKTSTIKEEEIPFIGESKKVKKATWPLYVVLGLLFVLIILATTQWNSVFGIEWFEEFHETVTFWSIKDHTILSYILGDLSAFGNWYFAETIMVLLLATGIIALIYKVKLDDVITNFGAGVKKVSKTAFLVMFAMTVLIITAYHPVYLTIVDWLMNLTTSFNVFFASISAILGSVLNVETVYLAQSLVSYLVGTFTSEAAINATVILTQSLYGLTMFVSPTSTMLILGLEYLDIPYVEWLKKSWKLILSLLVIILIIIVVVMLI